MPVIVGTPFADFLAGTALADSMFGLAGNDVLRAGAGNDYLNGGAGDDYLDGGTGDDLLLGGDGNDTLAGGAGADLLFGDAGADKLDGGDGDDVLEGGAGPDTLIGGAGNDTASYEHSGAGVTVSLLTGTGFGGDAAGDTLMGIENLSGSAFGDRLQGDAGNNHIQGGGGTDFLVGGGGADTFVFMSIADSTPAAPDLIADFTSAAGDKIDLTAIDADSTTAINDAFNYIGAGAFTGTAGELHFVAGIVEGDVNGDAVADFAIKVPIAALLATDFVL
jgi:Ca2+-binding RTX toxin-like protein